MTDQIALERRIADFIGAKHCFLTGHGSTAIYLALRVVHERRGAGEVLVPSIGCASIAQIILYAGFEPLFVDIRRDDFTMDVGALTRSITPRSRAILPVHIFGHATAMDEVLAVARANDLPVIEDAAQSLGGRYGGARLGSIGDFGVLSFGGTKIVSAGAGGAILTSDDDAAAIIARERETLPPFERSPRIALKSLSHRNLYHGAVDLLRTEPDADVSAVFRAASPHYRELYFHRFPEGDGTIGRIAAALDQLDANLEARVARAERYREGLAGLPVHVSDGGVRSGSIWRLTLTLETPEATFRATEALRRNGIHASNHYWSLGALFQGVTSLPNTSWFCPRALNLWVDEAATDSYIAKTCRVLGDSVE